MPDFSKSTLLLIGMQACKKRLLQKYYKYWLVIILQAINSRQS